MKANDYPDIVHNVELTHHEILKQVRIQSSILYIMQHMTNVSILQYKKANLQCCKQACVKAGLSWLPAVIDSLIKFQFPDCDDVLKLLSKFLEAH